MYRAVRFLSKPAADIAVSLPNRLATQRATMWAPQKSDPVVGLGLAGILAGTIGLCFLPAIGAMLAPPADDH